MSTAALGNPTTSKPLGFGDFLYQDQAGWLELCYIDGDPKKAPLKRDGWYLWPEARPTIVKRIEQLKQRAGNVYVSSTLYRKRERNAQYALDSRIIFVDDAPEHPSPSPSGVVRTSDPSRHSYYRLDRPVDTKTRERLQRRAAAALGGDRSGVDIVQVVRVPGTFNTKNQGHYPVTIEKLSERTYTTHELESAWPEVLSKIDTDTALEWPEVERCLTNIACFLGADGLPYRLSKRSQTYKLLADKESVRNRSDARYIVAKGCILHGMPNDETAALLIHFCDYGHSEENGSDWLYSDVARVIKKARAEVNAKRAEKGQPPITPQPTRAYLAAQGQPLPAVSRTPKGRPIKVTADGLHRWYSERLDAGDVVIISRKEVCAQLHISTATLDRLEKQLRDAGRLERHTSKDRRSSWVRVLGVIKSQSDSANEVLSLSKRGMPIYRIGKRQNSEAPCIKKEHTPLEDTARVQRPAIVREAMAAYGPRLRLVRRYIAANYPDVTWRGDQLKRLFESVKAEDQIAAMDNREILRAVRAADRNIARSQAQETKAYKFWLVRRNQLMREVRRRYPDLAREHESAVKQFADAVKRSKRRQETIRAHADASQQPSEPEAPAAVVPEPALSGAVCSLPAAEPATAEFVEIPLIRLVQPWRYKQNIQRLKAEAP